MALLYLDSCGDYYANEGILDKWRAYTVSGLSASITESGRTGKGIALGQLGGLSSIISRNLGASLRYVIGVAIKYPEGDYERIAADRRRYGERAIRRLLLP
jgi:hypothetical protein